MLIISSPITIYLQASPIYISFVDYIKGDSAYLYVTPKLTDETLTVASKDVIKAYILKGMAVVFSNNDSLYDDDVDDDSFDDDDYSLDDDDDDDDDDDGHDNFD
jgi:hypothetical protein